MPDDRRRIALTLSHAAMAMPPAERRAFRKFLFSLDGSEPKRRKIHSWKRKPAKAKRKLRKSQTARQMALPLD
jgi:hypothetical protein